MDMHRADPEFPLSGQPAQRRQKAYRISAAGDAGNNSAPVWCHVAALHCFVHFP